MKVFIATRGEYDDYAIVGVFSSEEAYDRFMDLNSLNAIEEAHPKAVGLSASGSHLNCPSRPHDFNEPIEIEVDSLPPVSWQYKSSADLYPNCTLAPDYPKDFIKATVKK